MEGGSLGTEEHPVPRIPRRGDPQEQAGRPQQFYFVHGYYPQPATPEVVLGTCEQVDASGNVVVSRERLTALIGGRDLVVVQAPGVTLVWWRCPW